MTAKAEPLESTTETSAHAQQAEAPTAPREKAPKAVADAADIEALFLDPKLGDGITETHIHSVPVDKPRDFFRTHPDPLYRRRTEIYTHKPEGVIDAQYYIIAPAMQGRIEEARPCTLVTVVNRAGAPRLWPISHPRESERDNEAWSTAREAAKRAIDAWLKLVWAARSYKTREAQKGYAPDPDWSKLPSFEELVRLAFGEHGIIRDETHPIYRELFGAANDPAGGGGDL
ncbi:hypothetical protein [Methylocystis suflitae]|uniref:hypothetical protein n=1 Tax=Methylocystis suflitae TaxID=2951405 RepID=UPI002108C9DE|nr:hypothetical protein [Methylocystis suflitae]MCQ4188854.1 hypothetical protein [Methylocystis suflitae]